MTNDIIDKIKSSCKISEVISTRIRITPAGNARFRAICPFHNEKTPSFYIDDNRGIYKCFGCNAGGDMIQFIKEFDKNNDFKEALETVAKIAGIEIPKTHQEHKQNTFTERIYAINQDACNYFKENLTKNDSALRYLESRGINFSSIKKYQFGFAPDSYRDLIKKLIDSGYTKDEILSSGFAKSGSDGSIYSIFRDRIIIPIFDRSGKCIAFGGRGMVQDSQPKYLNSLESPIFKKNHNLYNLHNAKNLTSGLNYIVMVEGYMDAIALDKHNIPSVAPLGTAMGNEQIELAKKYCKKLVFWFDSDAAGRAATSRSVKIALEYIDSNFEVSIVKSKFTKDPDEYIKEYGDSKARELISNAAGMHEFLWQEHSANIDIHNPNAAAKLLKNLEDICTIIKNPTLRREYSYYFKSQFYKEKFKKRPINNTNTTPEISRRSEDYETQGLIAWCIIQKPELSQNDEFNFNLSDQKFTEAIIYATENEGRNINLEIFDKIPIDIISENNIDEQFATLCLSYRLSILDKEIKNATTHQDAVSRIQIMLQERNNILEKIKKYTK